MGLVPVDVVSELTRLFVKGRSVSIRRVALLGEGSLGIWLVGEGLLGIWLSAYEETTV
jgi:hypothetical protein